MAFYKSWSYDFDLKEFEIVIAMFKIMCFLRQQMAFNILHQR